MSRFGVPKCGDHVMLFHGAVCPACLRVSYPKEKGDPRWLPAVVWDVDGVGEALSRGSQRTFLACYTFCTHKGHVWRRLQGYRRWLKRVPVTSNEWVPMRSDWADAMESSGAIFCGYFAEAANVPAEPEHEPWCLLRSRGEKAKKRSRHQPSSPASSPSLPIVYEEDVCCEEVVEFQPPARTKRSHSRGKPRFASSDPSPPAAAEEVEVDAPSPPPMLPSQKWTDFLPLGATEEEDEWGCETVAALEMIGLSFQEPSPELLAAVRVVLELRQAGFVQDCECADRLLEMTR